MQDGWLGYPVGGTQEKLCFTDIVVTTSHTAANLTVNLGIEFESQITGIQSYFGFSGIKVFILNTQKSQDISFPAIETRYLTLQLTKDAPDEFPSFVLERLQVINSPTSDFRLLARQNVPNVYSSSLYIDIGTCSSSGNVAGNGATYDNNKASCETLNVCGTNSDEACVWTPATNVNNKTAALFADVAAIGEFEDYISLDGKYSLLNRWPDSVSSENSSLVWSQDRDIKLVSSTPENMNFLPKDKHVEENWGPMYLSSISEKSIFEVTDFSGYVIPILSKSLWGEGLKGRYRTGTNKEVELHVKRAFLRLKQGADTLTTFAGNTASIEIKVVFENSEDNLIISFPRTFNLADSTNIDVISKIDNVDVGENVQGNNVYIGDGSSQISKINVLQIDELVFGHFGT